MLVVDSRGGEETRGEGRWKSERKKEKKEKRVPFIRSVRLHHLLTPFCTCAPGTGDHASARTLVFT